MRRWPTAAAVRAGVFLLVLFLVFAFSWAAFHGTFPEREEGMLARDQPIPYIRLVPAEGDAAPAPPRALIVHGLASNKEIMQILAAAMTDAGFETWSIDLPGHGDSPGAFSSEASLSVIHAMLDRLGPETVVIGHSLGGALLAETAATRPLGPAILLSPPPIPPIPALRVERLLIVSGRFDAPRINRWIPALVDAAPGAEWKLYPWAGHSTALYHPSQLRAIVEWAGGDPRPFPAAWRLLWLALMAVALLVAPAVGLWTRLRGRSVAGSANGAEPAGELVARVGALGAALVILAFVNPLGWLRLFAADYLIGVLLIAGLLLWRGRPARLTGRGAVGALLASAWVILAGVLALGTVFRVVPSGEQWLRFPVLVAAGLPLWLHEERTLRPLSPWWKAWGMFLAGRALVWAAVMTGAILLNPEAAFLVLIAHLIVVAWLPLWALAGLVRLRTGEPGAAALFAAIVQGWVFAALFVTI